MIGAIVLKYMTLLSQRFLSLKAVFTVLFYFNIPNKNHCKKLAEPFTFARCLELV